MAKMKKGFLKKLGCILISASIILTGFTFFGSTTSEAEGTWEGSTYVVTDGHIELGELMGYEDTLTGVTCDGNLTIDDSALSGFNSLSTIKVNGNLNLGHSALKGDEALSSVSCESMSGADATTFLGCTNIAFSISGGDYYIHNKGLYTGTKLIYVPSKAVSDNKYIIKEGTTVIGDYALDDTSITNLSFQNNSASSIQTIGTHEKWPTDGTHINITGAGPTSPIVEYFSHNYPNVILDGASTTYTITVNAVCDGTTFDTYTTFKTEGIELTVNAKSYDGYTISGDSSKVITADADDTISFTYTKDSPGPTPPGPEPPGPTPTTKYNVTVVEQAADGTVFKNETNQYEAGATISATPHDGYTAQAPTTYTVVAADNQSVTFTYTKNGSGGGTGGGGSGGGSSSESSTPAPVVKPGTVSAEAQTTNKYHITEGANQTVVAGSGPVRIVCDGPVDKFAYLLIDGNEVDKANYTMESGSTIITLTKEYVANLANGDHAVQFQYTDGYAFTTLKITGGTAATTTAGKTTTTVTYKVSSDGSISSGHTQDSTPKTADGFDNRYLLCLAIFLLGAGAILFSRQKKLEAILESQRDEY